MRPGHRLCHLCLPLLLLAMTPLVAQDQKQLDDLKALFEKDPAAGFVEAQRLFEKPKQAGDLDGMLAILAIVTDWSWQNRSCYPAPCLVMAETALPVATARGNWAAVGDIRWAQAMQVGINGWLRAQVLTQRATEAYAKAGQTPPGFTESKAYNERSLFPLSQRWHADAVASAAALPARIRPIAEGLIEAVEQADDNRASGLMMDLVAAAADAPSSVKLDVVGWVCGRMWLPGSERLLPELRRWIVEAEKGNPQQRADMTARVAAGCADGWSGGRDAFLETYDRCLHNLCRARVPTPWARGASNLAVKSVAFHQPEMADEILRLLLDLPATSDGVPARTTWPLQEVNLIHPTMPAELRRVLVQEQLRCIDWALRTGQPDIGEPDFGFSGWPIEQTAPKAERATWCLETAYQIADYASVFPTAESRSRVATEAATYFTKGGRPDLASQAQELAKSFAADDPKLRLQCALASGTLSARDGKWEDVVKGLEPVVTGASPSGSAIQATLLLEQAERNLGKTAEADGLLQQAQTLMGQVTLSPGERVSQLMALVPRVSDAGEKTALLEQARQAAAEAGLETMQQTIASQLAEVAIGRHDLPTARKALLDLVNQQEQQRDRLAFDPLLRQQWFADSLGTYRRLLRVAALQNDALLALSCGERMRSRALIDQLAWRKVDLAVRLPKALQDRLTALRESRREAYALLQQATGVGGESAGERGAYLPIRGLLPTAQAPPAGDPARLKTMLASLAQEETALESAIREAVPAYQAASQTHMPTGEELAQALARDPGLVVLEYTLCDEGLVVVGLRGGKTPRVSLIKEQGDAVWEHVGKFRQAIWERKDEAKTEGLWLYHTLISPMEPLLVGAKRLWVVADGALQLIPFGALQDITDQYLCQRMAVAGTPSLSLALTSRGARPKADLSALVVAAPNTGAVEIPGDERGAYLPIRGMYLPVRGAYLPIRGEGEVSNELTSMALVPLPGAKAEGEAVAKQFAGAKLLTGAEATKAALLEQGKTCDVLHIATHGYADPEVPEFSGLLLAGTGDKPYEVLTAEEVYLWDLRARLVTLSACQTGMGKTVEGEGLLGLTRAFIYAGAQDVVCSLWPVSDESTQKLMEAFYANLKTAGSVEEALTQAQRTLLQDEKTKNPFYWAAFVPVRGPQ